MKATYQIKNLEDLKRAFFVKDYNDIQYVFTRLSKLVPSNEKTYEFHCKNIEKHNKGYFLYIVPAGQHLPIRVSWSASEHWVVRQGYTVYNYKEFKTFFNESNVQIQNN